MLYFLIAFVIALFLLSFYTLGQDLFQPCCIVTASYVVSTLCAYINQDIWQTTIHSITVEVIAGGLLIFYFVNLISYRSKTKITVVQRKKNPVIAIEFINVDRIIFTAVILGQLLTLLIYYKEVVRIGGGEGLLIMMSTFRLASSYGGGESVSGIAGQLAKISLICAALFSFIFLNNVVAGKIKGSRRYLLPALIYIAQALLTGGRYNILVLFFSMLIMYNILWHQENGWKKTLEFKTLIRIVILICVLFAGFYWGRSLVGRQNDSDLITYIASYAGGSIPLFDMYLQNPIAPSEIWGKETFYGMLNNIRQLGIIDVPSYIVHLEFRSSNGIMIGNVYTAFRRQIQDFGLYGMIALQAIWSGIMSNWYKNIKRNTNKFGVLVYALMAYPLFLHSINDFFYMNLISIGQALTLIMTYIIYQFVIKLRLSRKVVVKWKTKQWT